MATQKLYLASDDTTCSAIVTDIADFGSRQRVRLDRTIFHPQGGGQKADRGTLAGFEVLDVRHADDGEVDHLVPSAPFHLGDEVALAIDAAWRDEGRRWHSAGHLLADCIVGLDANLRPLRGHHWPGEGRVEFGGDAVGLGCLRERLDVALKVALADDLPFKIVGDPYWSRALQIADHAPIPCGGTHVASAGALAGLFVRKVQQKEGVLKISYAFES